MERLLHVGRNKTTDVTPQASDFLNHPGAQEGVSLLGHHEYRFDSPVELTVHQGELKFKFEIRHGAKPSDHSLAFSLFDVVYEEPFKHICLRIRDMRNSFFHQHHAFLQGKQPLLGVILRDRHDYFIEKLGGPLHYIQMTIGEGIEASRVDDRAHNFAEYSHFRLECEPETPGVPGMIGKGETGRCCGVGIGVFMC
jgi:hypothetical protein